MAVVSHLPEADVDTDWNSTTANHYDAINDIGNGYDTEYIDSATETDQDSFEVSTDATYPSVLGALMVAYGRNDTGGTAKITPFVRINGTIYYGSELTLPAGTTSKRRYLWPTNPATGTLWSKAVIEAADWGYEVTEIS